MTITTDTSGNLHVGKGSADGGQFANKHNAAPVSGLATAEPQFGFIRTMVEEKVRLDHGPHPVPYPAGLPEPELTVGVDDSGRPLLAVRVGELDTFFWKNEEEEFQVANGYDAYIADADDAGYAQQADALYAWAQQAWQRSASAQHALHEALTQATQAQLAAIARGGATAESIGELDPASAFGNGTWAATVAKNAEQGRRAAALYGDEDEDGTHVADTIANLMIYARQQGWDFDDLLQRGADYASKELDGFDADPDEVAA